VTRALSLNKLDRGGLDTTVTKAIRAHSKPTRSKKRTLTGTSNTRLNAQTRKVLGKHYAAKYRSG
jgi:hypothetical protein